MRINDTEYENASIRVISEKRIPGATKMRRIYLYEAQYKSRDKTVKKTSENLGALQTWILQQHRKSAS